MTPKNPSRRHPRFRLIAALGDCALTSRDLDVLARVQSCRLITSEHLHALVAGSGQGLLRRLQKLFQTACGSSWTASGRVFGDPSGTVP